MFTMRTTPAFLRELLALGPNKSETIRRAVHLLHYVRIQHPQHRLYLESPNGTRTQIAFR